MKRTITTLTITALLIGAVTFLPVRSSGSKTGLVASAQAQDEAQEVAALKPQGKSRLKRCGKETIAGEYAYHATGTVVQSPAPQIPAGPFTTVGILTLNEDGTFAYKGKRSFNGFIDPAAESTGTYTVNDDCTATAVDNIGTPYHIVIADGGNELYIMFSAPGLVITAVCKRL